MEGRLSTDLVQSYTSDWQPGEDETRGVVVCGRLRACLASLKTLEPLLLALHGDGVATEPAKGAKLLDVLSKTRVTIELPQKLDEVGVARTRVPQLLFSVDRIITSSHVRSVSSTSHEQS